MPEVDPVGAGRKRSPSSHLRTLRRRRDFLRKRIEEPGREKMPMGDFDRAELHALEWAVELLEDDGA